MIEILTDQFAKLTLRILCLITGDTVHKRNLGPDNQPQGVATGIQVIRLLIMGKTDGGGTHIHDLCQVEVVVLILQGTSQAPPVLVTADSIHRIFLSVQIKTFTGYNLILTDPQRLDHFVNHLSILHQARNHLIKIRVFPPLPQMGMVQLEVSHTSLYAVGSQLDILFLGSNLPAFLSVNRVFENHGNRMQRGVIQFDFYGNVGRTLRYILLSDINAGGSTIINGDAALAGHDQPHRTIDASINAKQDMVHRNDIGTGLVVGLHHDFIIRAGFQRRTDFNHKS